LSLEGRKEQKKYRRKKKERAKRFQDMLKIIKGRKKANIKAAFQYRLLKEDKMLHTGSKKKVSLNELRRKPAGVGVLRNGGKEKHSTLRPRARIAKLSSRSA
jgi:hypothetical protein